MHCVPYRPLGPDARGDVHIVAGRALVASELCSKLAFKWLMAAQYHCSSNRPRDSCVCWYNRAWGTEPDQPAMSNQVIVKGTGTGALRPSDGSTRPCQNLSLSFVGELEPRDISGGLQHYLGGESAVPSAENKQNRTREMAQPPLHFTKSNKSDLVARFRDQQLCLS